MDNLKQKLQMHKRVALESLVRSVCLLDMRSNLVLPRSQGRILMSKLMSLAQ